MRKSLKGSPMRPSSGLGSHGPKVRLTTVVLALCAASVSFGQTAESTPDRQPTGVTPLPVQAPDTSRHTVLPGPASSLQKPLKPLGISPRLVDIDPRLANGPITLQDALSVALAANPIIAQAGEYLTFAEGKVGVTRSAFLPSISAGRGEAYILRIDAPTYGVQATMPLDISHLLAAATEQAHFQEVAARLDVNQARNDVMFQVTNAFYEALRAQALVLVAQENLKDSLDRLNDAQVRYKARAVAYFDVIRAQTDVANSQKQEIQTKNAVKNALAVLAERMGIDLQSSLSLTPTGAVDVPVIPASAATAVPQTESAVAETQPAAFGPEYQSVLKEAVIQRPEILEADANIAAAKKGVLIARRSVMPSFQLGVGYYYLRTQSGTQVNEPQAFIGLNVPLYDGGQARAQVQEALAQVASAVTGRRQQVDAVTLDVQQAYLALVEARDQTVVAGKALDEARAAFDLARLRYNTGVSSHAGISPLLEVSDAQAALTLAEQNQVNALYDYNNARAQLDRSAGRLAYVHNGPGFVSPPGDRETGK